MSENLNVESAPAVAVQRMVRRRWLYTVTDWNDDESHVDENGDEVCRDDAKEHIATDAEAAIESDRRADLWETKQDALVARVTRHSQGIVRESPDPREPARRVRWHVLPETIQRAVKRARRETGIMAVPHELRHSYATHCLNRGVNIKALSEALGVESPLDA